jgi:hypothetical protein
MSERSRQTAHWCVKAGPELMVVTQALILDSAVKAISVKSHTTLLVCSPVFRVAATVT